MLNAYSGWKLLGDQKLAYGLLVVLTFALHHERFFTKRSFTFFLMLSLAMLLLSGERKGWIAAIVGSLTLLSMAPHGAMSRKSLNRLLYFAIGFLALLAIVSVLAPLFPYLERQLTSTTNFIFGLLGIESELASSSNRDRLFLLRFGLQLFLENPFFGAGLDTFKAHIALLPGVIAVNGAHNEPLRIAAELGSVGLFLYMMLYVVGVFRILQIRALGRAIGELQFIKFRLATGLLAYGFIVNLFLAGGGVTLFLVVLPLGLLFSVPVRQSRRTAALPSSGYITQKMSVVSTVPSKWSDRD